MVDNETQHTCAHFEAECQCVHIEQMNIVDGVMSIDSDCFVLSARKLCFNFNFNTETFQVYDKTIDALNVDKILYLNMKLENSH